MNTKEAVKAAYERSDVCVVPAGGVVGEAMVALRTGRSVPRKIWRRFARKKRAGISTATSGSWIISKAYFPRGKAHHDSSHREIRRPGARNAHEAVEKFDEELQKLVADMFESMYAAQGVGLRRRRSASACASP
jgi:hypothetical protein